MQVVCCRVRLCALLREGHCVWSHVVTCCDTPHKSHPTAKGSEITSRFCLLVLSEQLPVSGEVGPEHSLSPPRSGIASANSHTYRLGVSGAAFRSPDCRTPNQARSACRGAMPLRQPGIIGLHVSNQFSRLACESCSLPRGKRSLGLHKGFPLHFLKNTRKAVEDSVAWELYTALVRSRSPQAMAFAGDHEGALVVVLRQKNLDAIVVPLALNAFCGDVGGEQAHTMPTWTDNRGNGSALNKMMTTRHPASVVIA